MRILRMDLNLNQKALAALVSKQGVDMSAPYLSSVENTDRIPSGEVLRALAMVLNTTTDYLLLLTDDPSTPKDQLANYPDWLVDNDYLMQLLATARNLSENDLEMVLELVKRLRAGPIQMRIIGEEEPARENGQ